MAQDYHKHRILESVNGYFGGKDYFCAGIILRICIIVWVADVVWKLIRKVQYDAGFLHDDEQKIQITIIKFESEA